MTLGTFLSGRKRIWSSASFPASCQGQDIGKVWVVAERGLGAQKTLREVSCEVRVPEQGLRVEASVVPLLLPLPCGQDPKANLLPVSSALDPW